MSFRKFLNEEYFTKDFLLGQSDKVVYSHISNGGYCTKIGKREKGIKITQISSILNFYSPVAELYLLNDMIDDFIKNLKNNLDYLSNGNKNLVSLIPRKSSTYDYTEYDRLYFNESITKNDERVKIEKLIVNEYLLCYIEFKIIKNEKYDETYEDEYYYIIKQRFKDPIVPNTTIVIPSKEMAEKIIIEIENAIS